MAVNCRMFRLLVSDARQYPIEKSSFSCVIFRLICAMETDLWLTDLFSFDIQYRVKVLGLFKRMTLEAAMILGRKMLPHLMNGFSIQRSFQAYKTNAASSGRRTFVRHKGTFSLC
jgi:hypothetical protein